MVGNCGELCNFEPNYIYWQENMRFIGNIEAKTDSKGRVFLPACFRRTLQANLVCVSAWVRSRNSQPYSVAARYFAIKSF